MKTLLAALALVVVPGLALAMGCSGGHESASQCAEGQVYDPALGLCIDKATS